jgi:hypothetical protein
VVTIDDERTRVTTWTFGARDVDTGPHVHEYDYIVVPITGGAFAVTAVGGTTRERSSSPDLPTSASPGPPTTSPAQETRRRRSSRSN